MRRSPTPSAQSFQCCRFCFTPLEISGDRFLRQEPSCKNKKPSGSSRRHPSPLRLIVLFSSITKLQLVICVAHSCGRANHSSTASSNCSTVSGGAWREPRNWLRRYSLKLRPLPSDAHTESGMTWGKLGSSFLAVSLRYSATQFPVWCGKTDTGDIPRSK